MLQFLCDTDHLTLLERGHAPVLAPWSHAPAQSVAISAVTVLDDWSV